jgi:hypothetical protein
MPVYTCPLGHLVVETRAYHQEPKTFFCPTCKKHYPKEKQEE